MINGSGRARANPGQAKINSQAKQAAPRVQGKSIRFKDDPDQISLCEDGACKIVPMRQGLTHCAGNESAEEMTLQGILRNLTFGLCGDLYDGKTACRKSAQQCIRASPSPAALPQKEAMLHNDTRRKPQGNSLFNLISPPNKAKDYIIPWNDSQCTFNVYEHLY